MTPAPSVIAAAIAGLILLLIHLRPREAESLASGVGSHGMPLMPWVCTFLAPFKTPRHENRAEAASQLHVRSHRTVCAARSTVTGSKGVVCSPSGQNSDGGTIYVYNSANGGSVTKSSQNTLALCVANGN